MSLRYGLILAVTLACGLGLAAAGEAEAVTLVSDARLTLPDFARKTGQDLALFEKRYAATGMVVCSGVYSTGQLTIKNDIVTTAAHAFYDADGNPRGDLATCKFEVKVEGEARSFAFDASSLQVGSRNPYAVPSVHDWAVIRLAQAVPSAQPYAVGTLGPVGTPVVLLAHRHRGWVHDGSKAIENCAVRIETRLEANSAREMSIDCSAGEGASGSAIMQSGQSDAIVGIYVGWRSTHPDRPGPFSPTHQNFGVALEGPFRSTLMTMTADAIAEDAKPPEHAAVPASTSLH